MALLLLATSQAHAQTPPETRLEIDATGTAEATPDELDATLAARKSGPDAATIQQGVNVAMQAALHEAATVAAVKPRTIGYDMSQDDKQVWTATSRIGLRSSDSVALLGLVGRLQSTGLVLESRSWELSAALHDRAQSDAMTAALHALVRRASAAAAALGLHVDRLADIRVSDGGSVQPRPFGVMRALAVPPAAPAAPMSVDVTASATMLLRP